MKKIISLVLVLVLAMALVAFAACGEDPNPNPGPQGGTLNTDKDYTGAGIVTEGSKIYLTSFGQADFTTLKTLVTNSRQANVTVPEEQIDSLLAADAVEAGSTVVCIAGYTTKGLAAGVTQSSETARAQAFAARNDINLVLVHIGGEGRRGANSDPMCKAIAQKAKLVLVWDDGQGAGGNIKIEGENFETWCNTEILYIFTEETGLVPSIKAILATK